MIRLAFFGAQGLLAFLPALLVLLIARADPEHAAQFSVTMGVVGAIFSIAYFGQRAYVAVRGFDAIACREALGFRLLLSLVAACLTLIATRGMNIGSSVALFAVGLKLSESVVDLWVGIRIRTSSDRQTSWAYLLLAATRALLIMLPLLWFGAVPLTQASWAPLYLIALAAMAYLFAHLDTRRLGVRGSYWVSPRRALRLGWEMRSFVSATAVCALLSSMPRVILPYSEAGAYSGAALALSIVPLFGLALQALWLSRLKRMTEEGPAQMRHFVVEVGAVVLVGVCAWPVWEWVARRLYSLDSTSQQESFAGMVAAGVILSAAVSLSNLFKLTTRPRNESFSYALGLGTVLGLVFLLGSSAAIAMACAAGAMGLYVWFVFRASPNFVRLHRALPS